MKQKGDGVMNEVALRKRIAVIVIAAMLSVIGAAVTATAVADDPAVAQIRNTGQISTDNLGG
jgi:hypothetical protein